MRLLISILSFLLMMGVLPAQQGPIVLITNALNGQKTIAPDQKAPTPNALSEAGKRQLADQPVKSLTWRWDSTGKKWDKNNQTLYTYNPGQALIYALDQFWEKDTWIDKTKTSYVYTPTDSLRMFQFEAWENNDWVLYVRYIYDYDAQNRLSCFTIQDWIDDKWIDRSRIDYQYDHYLNYACRTVKNWFDGAWHNESRETDYTNSSGRIKTRLNESWCEYGWSNDLRQQYTWRSDGQLESILKQKYDHNAWKDSETSQYSYDAYGNLISLIVARKLASPWYTDFAWVYAYDEHNNRTESSFWTIDDNTWTVQSRDQNDFDANDRRTSTLSQVYTSYWANREYTEFEYANVTAVATPDISDEMLLYPNPARNQLSITLPDAFTGDGSIVVCSLDGRICLAQTVAGGCRNTIDISPLPAGMYVLHFRNAVATGSKVFSKN